MKSLALTLLIPFSFITLNSNAQSISITPEIETRINTLFDEWNSPNSPGATIGILSGSEIIYSNGFGSKSILSKEPINTNTEFRMGGMSLHFTAFAILLLEDRGKISLNDEIQQYLPFLPNYDFKITIHNLLSHSSGLPDYWSLKTLSGYSDQNQFTIEHAKELFSKKWNLTNEPGEEYVFSGTAGFLLAQIVEQVSGMPFSQFAKTEIFQSLGMDNTYFVDDLVYESPSLSTSYSLIGESLIPQDIGHSVPGPANLVTTMSDLMKWYKNMNSPVLGSKKMITKLDTRIEYKPGHYSHSPNGWLTYGQHYDHFERSLKSIWDFGAMGGFASSMFRFTEYKNLTIIVLSNNGLTYNGYLGMQTADILLESEFKTSEQSLSFIPLTDQISELFVGDYFNIDEYFHRQIILRDDTLRYYRPLFDNEDNILPISTGELAMASPFGTNFIRPFNFEGKNRLEFITEDASFFFEKFDLIQYSEDQLKDFEGTYYSDDLSLSYTIALKGGQLFAKNNRAGEIPLSQFKENFFIGSTPSFNRVNFQRSPNNSVISFELSSPSLEKIHFRKI